MKELEMPLLPNNNENIELSVQMQQEKKLKYMGNQVLRKGHKCFEINTETMEVNEASYMKKDITLTDALDESYLSRSIMQKQNCIYINALNKKNALKKFIQKKH